MKTSGRKAQSICLQIYLQALINLTQKEGFNLQITGAIFDESKELLPLQKANNNHELFHLFLNKLILCYLFEDSKQALTFAKIAEQYLDGVVGQVIIATFYFYDSLTKLQCYLKASESDKKKLLKQINFNQKKLKKWSNYAPENFLHKFHLVKAEKYRVLGKYNKAIKDYENSIQLAQENKYIQEQALANELAAKFYLALGKVTTAKGYIQESRYWYSRWGSLAKIRQIESQYIELLKPQLSVKTESINLNSNSNTSVSLSQLDWLSIIKVSQALSGTIILEQLLTQLMKILIENTGASRGYLLWGQDSHFSFEELDNWQIVSFDGLNNSQSEPSSKTIVSHLARQKILINLPRTIINTVLNSHETVVVSDRDFELQSQCSQSVVCLPLLNQNRLLGLLYLENDVLSGVFSDRRLEFLEVLSSQIAISLDNVLLYQKLEQANQQPKYRILVASEAGENLDLLVQLLTTVGFEVRTSKNGKQTLDIWLNWSPHLILMDLNMPAMDGYEAIKEIRTREQTETTKIIILTAQTLETEPLTVRSFFPELEKLPSAFSIVCSQK